MPAYQEYSHKYNKVKRVFSLRLETKDLLGILDYLKLRQLEAKNISQMVVSFIQSHLEDYRTEDIIPSYAGINEAELDDTLAERITVAGKLSQARLSKVQRSQLPAQQSRVSEAQRTSLSSALGNSDLAPPNNWVPDFVSDASPLDFTSDPSDFLPLPANDPNNLGRDEILAKASELTLEELYPGSKSEFGFDDLDDLLQLQISEMQAQEAQELMAKLTIGTVPILDSKASEKTLSMLEERDERLAKDKLWKTLCKAENELGKRALRIVYFNLPEEHWSSNKAEDLLKQITLSIKGQSGLPP